MDEDILKLQDIVDKSKNIVFFGGAGVSTESGIPDFRSKDGLYNQKYKFPPETIISHDFFENNPEEFYRFYRDKILITGVKPDAAHIWLAEAEKRGKVTAVVTQNIDGLHQAAGSRRVYELHGTIYKNHCVNCGKSYSLDYITQTTGVPKCSECGGIIKPDVVLYDEDLDMDIVNGAVRAIASCDTLIVAGTSLTVYPAAGLITFFQGQNLVLINRDATEMDGYADLLIRGSIGKILSQISINGKYI